jgi:hypothetical protein
MINTDGVDPLLNMPKHTAGQDQMVLQNLLRDT